MTYLPGANSKPIEIPEKARVFPGPGRVLVRLADAREGRYGPIILPPTSDSEARFFGRVEAMPTHFVDDLDEDRPWLKEGDLVFFGKYSGTKLSINRDSFIICRESDILAAVEDASMPAFLEEAMDG